ncbi:MAG: hypothetical protein MSA65_03645 [Mollicutes bacterium]|nr:hypothetical protein [Mollicutes bacterium]
MAEGNRNFIDQVYVTNGESPDKGEIIDIGAKAENVYFNDDIILPKKLEEYQKKLIAGTDSGIKITNDNQISINLDNLQLLKIQQLTNVISVVNDILPYYEEHTLYYGDCQGLIVNDNSPIIKLENIKTKSFFMFIQNAERFIIFSSGRIWRSKIIKDFPEQEVFTLIQNSINNISSFSYFNSLNEFLQLAKNDKKTFSYISIKNEKNIEDGEYLSLPIGETTKILINDSGIMYISHYINNLWEKPKKIVDISALENQINQKQDMSQRTFVINGDGNNATYPTTRAVVRYVTNFLNLTKSVTSTYNYVIDNTSPRLIYVVLNQNQDNFPRGEYFVLSFGTTHRIWISGSNGDIYTQNSNDQGETWEQPVLKAFGTTIDEDALITKIINRLPKYEGDIVTFEDTLENIANDSY